MIDLTKYPKSKEKFLEFTKLQLKDYKKSLFEEMKKGMSEVPQEVLEVFNEEIENSQVESVAANMALSASRNMFDFFDDNKIFFAVNVSAGLFDGQVDYGKSFILLQQETSRKSLEEKGFEVCFNKLEEKL